MVEPNPQLVEVTDHDEGQEQQERQVINALSLLRAPEKSDLPLKRKIGSNDPCKNRNTRLVHAKTATAKMFLQQQESGNFQMNALTTLHRTKMCHIKSQIASKGKT